MLYQYRIIMMKILRKLHGATTNYMAKLWIVEHILIAKVTEEEDGALVTYDCIYCTILRNAIIFFVSGTLLGLAL